MDVGKHCHKCGQLDFLPFVCDKCNKVFCRYHRIYETHNCQNYNLNNNKLISNLSTGQFKCKICNKIELIEIKCKICDTITCLQHKFPDQHKCGKKRQLTSGGSTEPNDSDNFCNKCCIM